MATNLVLFLDKDEKGNPIVEYDGTYYYVDAIDNSGNKHRLKINEEDMKRFMDLGKLVISPDCEPGRVN